MSEVVKTAVEEAAKEVTNEVATTALVATQQAVATTQQTFTDKAVNAIKINKNLIMWTLIFAGIAVGGYYMWNQHKAAQQLPPVEVIKNDEKEAVPVK